ncbi:MAG TPA: MOSC domain-containing protein [Bacillales bacterium]|nr:MOSC domain-containing protein [Bacillales bacterium]
MLGKLIEIRRFPVKSLLGELLVSAEVNQRGLVGDRLWAIRNEKGKFGSGKTTRRFQRVVGLLEHQARYEGEIPIVTMPDGTEFRVDEPVVNQALSQSLGCQVTLAREETISHFDQCPISLITTSSLRQLGKLLDEPIDPRRFRANLLIDTEGDGFIEDEWVNQVIQVGPNVTLKIVGPIQRCVMINLPQENVSRDNRILRCLASKHDANFGVYATVETSGCIEVGQSLAHKK